MPCLIDAPKEIIVFYGLVLIFIIVPAILSQGPATQKPQRQPSDGASEK